MAKKQQLQGEVIENYIMTESFIQPNCWILIDIENGIAIHFEDGKFNETIVVVVLDYSKLRTLSREELATEVPKITRPIVKWAIKNHKSKCVKYHKPTK